MIQLKFISNDNVPMGVINWFPVHPTSMNNTNTLVSSDNVGYASIKFEKMMNPNHLLGNVSPKTIFFFFFSQQVLKC